jgi:hypothetical protein
LKRAAVQVGAADLAGDWQSALARSGLVAKGVLYAALGILAINVASGQAASGSVTKRGAIELVAGQPLGQWLLSILTVGLFALAIWYVILAFRGDPVEGRDTTDRLKNGGKALVYFATAGTALNILMANWGRGVAVGGGQGPSEKEAASTVMGWPGGPWLVALIGAAVVALAAQQLYKHAWKARFMDRLNRGRMSPAVQAGVERAGRSGYAARAIVFAIVGGFLVVAALRHNPSEAVGLSGALQVLAEQTWGDVLLGAVALGLFFYGMFAFAEAKYRRAT